MVSGPHATPEVKYIVTLAVVVVLTLLAKNLVRSATGRAWMAIRDMDIAAEIIGVRPLRTKLLAFAISSFYCGVAGAMYVFTYVGNADTEAFDLIRSFNILFMIIIGGMGSIMGSYLGAAFIVLLPVFLNIFASAVMGGTLSRQRALEPGADRVRRHHHLLPDRGAARLRPPVADREGEAEAVAVPVLSRMRSRNDEGVPGARKDRPAAVRRVAHGVRGWRPFAASVRVT